MRLRRVVEHSVYVAEAARGRGFKGLLLDALIASTEGAGIWTIQTGVLPENATSLALHERCGSATSGSANGSAGTTARGATASCSNDAPAADHGEQAQAVRDCGVLDDECRRRLLTCSTSLDARMSVQTKWAVLTSSAMKPRAVERVQARPAGARPASLSGHRRRLPTYLGRRPLYAGRSVDAAVLGWVRDLPLRCNRGRGRGVQRGNPQSKQGRSRTG
jgi:hypothetical protein